MSITYFDFAKTFDPHIPLESVDYALWNYTAYPLSDVRTTAYQLRRAIRCRKNGRDLCVDCLMESPRCTCRRAQ